MESTFTSELSQKAKDSAVHDTLNTLSSTTKRNPKPKFKPNISKAKEFISQKQKEGGMMADLPTKKPESSESSIHDTQSSKISKFKASRLQQQQQQQQPPILSKHSDEHVENAVKEVVGVRQGNKALASKVIESEKMNGTESFHESNEEVSVGVITKKRSLFKMSRESK